MDTDQSGELSKEEYEAAYGQTVDFASVDINNDNKISKAEFVAAHRSTCVNPELGRCCALACLVLHAHQALPAQSSTSGCAKHRVPSDWQVAAFSS